MAAPATCPGVLRARIRLCRFARSLPDVDQSERRRSALHRDGCPSRLLRGGDRRERRGPLSGPGQEPSPAELELFAGSLAPTTRWSWRRPVRRGEDRRDHRAPCRAGRGRQPAPAGEGRFAKDRPPATRESSPSCSPRAFSLRSGPRTRRPGRCGDWSPAGRAWSRPHPGEKRGSRGAGAKPLPAAADEATPSARPAGAGSPGSSCPRRSAVQSTAACARSTSSAAEVAELERVLARFALRSPEVRRLMSGARGEHGDGGDFPGLGRRHPPLPDAPKLVGYLGLDPRVRQSGESAARHGRISKRGSAAARHMLCEAAWSGRETPGPLQRLL